MITRVFTREVIFLSWEYNEEIWLSSGGRLRLYVGERQCLTVLYETAVSFVQDTIDFRTNRIRL